MIALSPVLRDLGDGRLAFWCPACMAAHPVRVREDTGHGPEWSWDRNVEAPTFSPSILVRDVVRATEDRPKHLTLCHAFVTKGRILFLGDCTHDLAGQTVDLPLWPTGDQT